MWLLRLLFAIWAAFLLANANAANAEAEDAIFAREGPKDSYGISSPFALYERSITL
jgi:hypothetical protein